MKYLIVRREDRWIGKVINELTEAVNILIADGWEPIGSPNVKRDSTQRQSFIAFQAMVKEEKC